MKKLLIATVLVAIVFIIGCQAPQDIKAQLDKQSTQIQTLEKTIQDNATKLEQMKMDYEKHMVDLHKQKATAGSTTPVPPTRVGR
jgi:outer membrane murein-binding lipoprotein Lpp